MTEEINDTSDDMVEGEFLLNEFIDRFGPRLAHLNGVIQSAGPVEQRAESDEFAARLIGGFVLRIFKASLLRGFFHARAAQPVPCLPANRRT